MFNRHNSFNYLKKLAILLVLSSQIVGNQFLISAADARVLSAQIGDLEFQIEDPEEQADNLRKAGIEHLKAKRFTQAEDSLKRAWRIYRDLGDNFKIGLTLNDLGLVYRYQEDYRSSAAVYSKAIEAFEEANNLKGQWTAWYNFGVLSYQKGLSYPEQSREQKISFRQALNRYDRALSLIPEITQPSSCLGLNTEIRTLIAEIYEVLELNERASDTYQKLQLLKEKLADQIKGCSPIPLSKGQSIVSIDDGDLFD